MSRILVRYQQYFGRSGSLEDLFVTTPLELLALKCVGKVHRGEVLGKHSDVTSILSDETLSVLTDDDAFINKAIEVGLIAPGNPYVSTLCHDSVESAVTTRDILRCRMSAEDFAAVIKLWDLETIE